MDPDAFATSIKTALVDAVKALAGQQKTTPSKNYVEPPAHYDGHRNTYETFRRGLDLYVKVIAKDRDKIVAALSFLTKGDADSWAQLYVQVHNAEIEANSISWSTFLEDLDKKFLDPRLAESAREQLFQCVQGRLPADSFFLKFDDLRVKSGLVDEEHHDVIVVEHLKKAMNPQLVLAVFTSHEANKKSFKAMAMLMHANKVLSDVAYEAELEKLKRPIPYVAFRELALENDPNVRRFGHAPSQRERLYQPEPPRRVYHNPPQVTTTTTTAAAAAPTGTNAHPTPPAAAHTPARAREPDVVPMDVDRTRSRSSLQCYRCRKFGHIARDCQERNLREVIRGLTEEDLDEIVRVRTMAPGPIVEEDFSAPQ